MHARPFVVRPSGRHSVPFVLVAICSLLTASPPATAGTIYWNMQTLAATSTDVSALTAGDLTRGNGGISTVTGTASVSAGYSFLLAGTSNPASGGNNLQSSALGGALVTGSSAYFAISLSNTASYPMMVTGVGFGSRSTGTGPAAYSLRSSLDGYTADISGGAGTLLTTSTWVYYANSFSSPLEIASGSTTQVRLYGYGGTAANLNNLTWRIDDLQVIVVPETSTGFATAVIVCLIAVASRTRSAVSRPSRT